MKVKWISLMMCAIPLALLFVFLFAAVANAQAGFGGGTYNQDFDSLATSGTTNSSLPSGWALTEAGGGARDNEQYGADNGGSTTGDVYSYGTTSSTERAFGELTSGSLQGTIGVQFKNNTGKTIGILTIAYICEQWRDGTSTDSDRMDFQYSTNASSLTTGTWTDVNTLDCDSTVTGSAGSALDGNLNTNRTSKGPIDIGSTGAPLNILSGATFWLKWIAVDITGFDDGLAVDDFSLSAKTPTAVTLRTLTAAAPITPWAALPAAGLAALAGFVVYRRRAA